MTIIKTTEFILRPISQKDVQGYWECMQDEETKKGFMSTPKDFDEAKNEVQELIEKSNEGITEVFTIEVEGKYAGNVKLDWQNWNTNSGEGRVHLWLHPKFRGQNVATKALKKLIEYGFKDKKMNIIYAQCKKANSAVCRVNEKAGFRKVEERIVDGVEKIWWEIKNDTSR